jgi:hypothetical protein
MITRVVGTVLPAEAGAALGYPDGTTGHEHLARLAASDLPIFRRRRMRRSEAYFDAACNISCNISPTPSTHRNV